jgi:hypothetical protein
VPKRWELDLRPGPLRIATVETEEGPRAYFYFTYTVVNNSGRDLLLAPSFELSTETGVILRSGRSVPTGVTRALLERLDNPFLQDEVSIIGTIQQGEEFAREGLVIWPAEDLKADEVVIFAEGFSGETRVIQRPDNGEEVVLRKTMMLRHDAPGDMTVFGDTPLQRVEQRWILR